MHLGQKLHKRQGDQVFESKGRGVLLSSEQCLDSNLSIRQLNFQIKSTM